MKMTDLRKAAEMALEVMEYNRANGTPNMGAAIEALRQALAQPEQEPVGYVTIENISSWSQVPSIKWFKKPTEGPLYTAPVDAVNMRQERVDETAKSKHEPVAWVYNGILHEFDPSEFATSEVKPLYTAPPKREWQGLMDEEIDGIYKTHHDQYGKCQTGGFEYERTIEAKLKEKNT